MQSNAPDLTNLLVALLTLISSKEIAVLVGPYAAIVLASGIAAGWALSGVEEELNGWKSARFFLIRILTAVIFTVTISSIIHDAFSSIPMNVLFIVVAFSIGLIKNVADMRDKVTAGWEWAISVIPRKGPPDGK